VETGVTQKSGYRFSNAERRRDKYEGLETTRVESTDNNDS
jgi:hypothetical protein